MYSNMAHAARFQTLRAQCRFQFSVGSRVGLKYSLSNSVFRGWHHIKLNLSPQMATTQRNNHAKNIFF